MGTGSRLEQLERSLAQMTARTEAVEALLLAVVRARGSSTALERLWTEAFAALTMEFGQYNGSAYCNAGFKAIEFFSKPIFTADDDDDAPSDIWDEIDDLRKRVSDIASLRYKDGLRTGQLQVLEYLCQILALSHTDTEKLQSQWHGRKSGFLDWAKSINEGNAGAEHGVRTMMQAMDRLMSMLPSG